MANATWHLVRPAQERPFVVAGDVIVGRSKESNLRISEGFVSRRHARLWLDGSRLMVEDLGSANGTFVNGDRITVRACLEPGDRVCFDETEFHVEFHGDRAAIDPNATVNRPNDDEDPEFRKPERPAQWVSARTQIMDSGREAPPSSASGPTRKRPLETASPEIDFDLDLESGGVPLESAPAQAARSSRSPTIDEPDFDLGLTGESPASGPASSSTPPMAPTAAVPAAARAPTFDSLDLSLGSARVDDEPDPRSPSPAAAATVVMGPDAPGAAGPAAAAPGADAMGMLGLSGPVEGHLYALAHGRVTIGRAPECDIMIEEGSVSKRHAELIIQPGNCRIHDLSRANGVFVNGNQAEDAPLNPGDVIRLGRIEFMFDDFARLADGGGEADAVPAWVWMIAGFVGAGAVLAIGALFVL